MISANLGKRFCNLQRSPIVWFIFPDTTFRWSSNFNWLSSIIPYCFWEEVRLTLALLKSNGRWIFFFSFVTKNDFLSLLSSIWIKVHFLLSSSLIFSKSIKFICKCLNVIYNTKQIENISRNTSDQFPNFWWRFLVMLKSIFWNLWWYSPKTTIFYVIPIP